jgi:Rrf2 family protein
MFSKACEYGIRAVIYIASKTSQSSRVSLKEIAEKIDSPEAFTAKILQQLSRSGIIDSVKGPTGGFAIRKKEVKEVKLIEIVLAIDGNQIFEGCGLGLTACSETEPCPVHFEFKAIRDGLKKMLEEANIHELSEGMIQGLTFLKRN